MSCGAQSYLEGIAQSPDEIHYANEDSYIKQGINIHLNSDVVGLDPEEKTITVKTDQGEEAASYDKLLLSPGGYAPRLNIPGKDMEHVYTFRGRDDAEIVKARMADAKNVYAGGDATYLHFNATGNDMNIGLATNARKQGVTAAKNALGGKVKAPGVNGTSGLAFFDLKFATTGIKDSTIHTYDGEVKSFYCEEKIRPDFMNNEENTVEMKIFYDADTEVILGAQFLSKEDITQAANTMSLAITAKMTLTDLAQADFFFQPGFSRPWHFLNVLAMKAQGQTYGSTKMLF